MKRHAFTLMELLVSVALLTLIVLFMYGAIGSSKLANKTLKKHSIQEQNRTMVFNLLYRDLFESISVEVLPTQNKHFTLLHLQTNNTLHQVAAPYVSYYVDSQTKKLIRLEAAKKINLPIRYEDRYRVYADIIISDVSDFNLYTSLEDANLSIATDKQATLSSSDDTNVSEPDTQETSHKYLLYLKADTLTQPLLMELSL